MQSAIHEFPNELFDRVLRHLDPVEDAASLRHLALCSRSLHRIATPWLYKSIVVTAETLTPLLHSLLYNPYLRGLTHTLTLCVPIPTQYMPDLPCSSNDLVKATISEIMSDDVWLYQPQGWCSNRRHVQEIPGCGYGFAWCKAVSISKNWNARSALLLALMPGATRLNIQIDSFSIPFARDGAYSYITIIMMATANTQQRNLAANDAPHTEGVLPRLRSVCVSAKKNQQGSWNQTYPMQFQEFLMLALPPLAEGLHFFGLYFTPCDGDWQCPDCAAQTKLTARTLVFKDCESEAQHFCDFVSRFSQLEKLNSLPRPSHLFHNNLPSTDMRTVLESTADTLRELDLIRDSYDSSGDLKCTSFSSFSVLDLLSLSARQLVYCWLEKDKNGQGQETLCGKFPQSLRMLSVISSPTRKDLSMETVLALIEVLKTKQLPALRQITFRNVKCGLTVGLSRQCKAQGIRFYSYPWSR